MTKFDPSLYTGERRSDLSNLSIMEMAKSSIDFILSQQKALDEDGILWGH